MESNLKGKTVFVTEALRHFGTPMALAFAREGANLFLATMSDHEPLEDTARTLAALGVKVVTERAGGKIFVLTGNEAQAARDESHLLVNGNVVLTVSDGMNVRTDRATYAKDEGLVRAPGNVEFSRGRLSGTGVGLTYDKNREVATILEQATVRVAHLEALDRVPQAMHLLGEPEVGQGQHTAVPEDIAAPHLDRAQLA